MYSYADRLRAVELYIRLGKRLNGTIRQQGYPTKNALRAGTASTYSIATSDLGRPGAAR